MDYFLDLLFTGDEELEDDIMSKKDTILKKIKQSKSM